MSQLKTNLESILAEKEQKIIANNIRNGVTIFNVTGTLVEEDPEHADYDECVIITNQILGNVNNS